VNKSVGGIGRVPLQVVPGACWRAMPPTFLFAGKVTCVKCLQNGVLDGFQSSAPRSTSFILVMVYSCKDEHVQSIDHRPCDVFKSERSTLHRFHRAYRLVSEKFMRPSKW